MKRNRASSRSRSKPGRASDYIEPVDSIHAGDKIVICCRVSRGPQKSSGNLLDQESDLCRAVNRYGAKLIDIEHHVGNGRDPSWLSEPAALAKRRGAKLFAESTDRFVRHPEYNSKKRPDLQARLIDLERLRSITNGVPLITFIHPDTPPSKVRSHQTTRGQKSKGRRGGRPIHSIARPGDLVRRRAKFLPQVQRLHKAGCSIRQISADTGIPSATVQRWLTP